MRRLARRWHYWALVGVAIVLSGAFLDLRFFDFFQAMTVAQRHGIGAATEIGNSQWYLVPTGAAVIILSIILYVRRNRGRNVPLRVLRSAFFYVFVTVAVPGILIHVAKTIVGRPRPRMLEDYGAFGFQPFSIGGSDFASFPSGHATTMFSLAFALSVLAPPLRVPFFIVAVWFALTRAIVGSHYLSDVIAGAAFGIALALVVRHVFVRYDIFLREASDGRVKPRGLRVVYRAFRRAIRARRQASVAAQPSGWRANRVIESSSPPLRLKPSTTDSGRAKPP